MLFVSVLRVALYLLIPLSTLLTGYIYHYPLFHGCAFPSPEQNVKTEYLQTLRSHTPFLQQNTPTKLAPFRLLAFGDPQLEGDSSIHNVEAASYPHFFELFDTVFRKRLGPLQRLRSSLHIWIDFWLEDLPDALGVYRKRIDHFGNDYYLGHQYRVLSWWSNPTHVTVLGDLVGSQWIDNEEFERRASRFWNRAFPGGRRLEDGLMVGPSEEWTDEDFNILGEEPEEWKTRIINVAGNHDIGYAGDLSQERMARFTRVFGRANYEMRFRMPINPTDAITGGDGGEVTGDAFEEQEKSIPELRIIVLNDMNLDTPASSKELQDETYNFLNSVITTSYPVDHRGLFTILLTHIPMYKPHGICVDGPFFDFFNGEFGNGVKEQNTLSLDASKGFLEGIYGMNSQPDAPGGGYGRNGVMLMGHDHEGCDVWHYVNQTAILEADKEWKSIRYKEALKRKMPEADFMPGIRELTVRSMMGGFGGNVGMLGVWFDEETWEWQYEFSNCALGTQHLWWIVHIFDLITLIVIVALIITMMWEQFLGAWVRKWMKSLEKTRIGKAVVEIHPMTPISATGHQFLDLVKDGNFNGLGAEKPRITRPRRSTIAFEGGMGNRSRNGQGSGLRVSVPFNPLPPLG